MEPTLDAKDPVVSSPTVVPDAPPVASSPTDPGAKPAATWDSFEPTTEQPSAPPADKGLEPVAPAPPVATPVAATPPIEPKDEPATPTPPDDTKLPFHEHPRWKEVLKERDDLKQASEAIRPFIDQQKNLDNYLRSNAITETQFGEALSFLALRNSNPAEAYAKFVKPMVEEFATYEGSKLPQDLQEKVDRGTLTADDAKDWARQRATTQFNQQRTERDAARRFEEEQASALGLWETETRKRDLDYPRKAKMVHNRHLSLVSEAIGKERGPLSPTKLVTLASQAYREVCDELSAWAPQPKPTNAALSPQASPSKVRAEPKTWAEAEDYVASTFAHA